MSVVAQPNAHATLLGKALGHESIRRRLAACLGNICAVTLLAKVSGALWGGLQLYNVYMAEEFERVLWYQEDLESDRLLEAAAPYLVFRIR